MLINCLRCHGLPSYIVARVTEFLNEREFYCVKDSFSSGKHKQTRGLPQGSVLLPALFNILMCTIPIRSGAQAYVYVDDIAFFAMAADIHCHYETLQSCLSELEKWLDGLQLSLNTKKCAILVFPVNDR